jgi:hypothetical protein
MTANRKEHCAFAVLNTSGKCIADCHRNWDNDFEQDCIGIETDYELIDSGREVVLGRSLKLGRS